MQVVLVNLRIQTLICKLLAKISLVNFKLTRATYASMLISYKLDCVCHLAFGLPSAVQLLACKQPMEINSKRCIKTVNIKLKRGVYIEVVKNSTTSSEPTLLLI